MHRGRAWITSDVDDIDAVTGECRHDQEPATTGRVVIATGASVPARVVELVSGVRHLEAVDHLV